MLYSVELRSHPLKWIAKIHTLLKSANIFSGPPGSFRDQPPVSLSHELTPREKEILQLIYEEFTSPEIAEKLHNTVPEEIKVYDMTGRKMDQVRTFPGESATRYCSVQQLPAGHYLLKVTTKNGSRRMQPFIRQ